MKAHKDVNRDTFSFDFASTLQTLKTLNQVVHIFLTDRRKMCVVAEIEKYDEF